MLDKVNLNGYFSIKSLDKDGKIIDFYEDKNLIVNTARSNMAEIIGGVTGAGSIIDRFVIGTFGHMATDILDAQQVDETDAAKTAINTLYDTFDVTREQLFSEILAASANSTCINYKIDFDVTGAGLDVTDSAATGQKYIVAVAGAVDASNNTVQRVVLDKTVTYTITIPVENANHHTTANTPVPYTEAGLYAGADLFAMKTFPGRVKENTAQFIITWSIIF